VERARIAANPPTPIGVTAASEPPQIIASASPREITHDKEAVDKQKRLIDLIHGKGAEVVISSHMNEALSPEQVLEHLQAFELRGADVVKIVTAINTEEEFSEAVRATMLLRRELKTPFIHLCNGTFGRLHRFLGPALGVSIVFAVHRYESRNPMTQPTIQAMKTVFENLHWHIDDIQKSGYAKGKK
jgi:3-dehydroquinate dehydratase